LPLGFDWHPQKNNMATTTETINKIVLISNPFQKRIDFNIPDALRAKKLQQNLQK
jgi:hypothetical protein